jgi:hypothetical protein
MGAAVAYYDGFLFRIPTEVDANGFGQGILYTDAQVSRNVDRPSLDHYGSAYLVVACECVLAKDFSRLHVAVSVNEKVSIWECELVEKLEHSFRVIES